MKSTVVSLVPYEIPRSFPGVFPGEYIVPACIGEDPGILVVGDAKYYVYAGFDRGFDQIEDSNQIANSICKDFINAQLYANDDAFPGIFWVPGEYDVKTVKIKFKREIERAIEVQKNWFKLLVKHADDDWQRYHQYKTISDLQRNAAKWLNLKRDWIDIVPEDIISCPACGIDIKKKTAVCFNCKAILDVEAAKQFQFAKVG